ncbi:hypothetical protein [Cognatilysobacter lacus]|uniref:Uncharacterized protein n=1 Tax=Cognatilysobacter lacus TaxID=1643323 RepID=A0A5D8ZC83_9GAMM|nr:hypothetical protein [Lysobacter lacus]TZF90284.1 hypothetical protein FW784_05975 [Lysobacter lacus]
MRLHAFQLTDGTMHVVAERLAAVLDARSELDCRDLGVAEVDLARLSPNLVRGIGLDAWAIARGGDAQLIQSALAVQAN